MWWNAAVKLKMQAVHQQGYEVKLVTNQGRLTDLDGRMGARVAVFQQKMEAVAAAMGIPVTVFVACGNDRFRKPNPDTWEVIVRDCQRRGQALDADGSYFVGDAAGRPLDHADADRAFSVNIGIAFYTPEDFFLGRVDEQAAA